LADLPEPDRATESTRRVASRALLVALAVYVGYAALALVPEPVGSVRHAVLVAAFYFLPGLVLRRDPARQARYQVGPDSPLPPWSKRGSRLAFLACLLMFPPFVAGFLWFYAKVCAGDLSWLAPVVWVESFTPLHGGLERFFADLCVRHGGDVIPDQLRVPEHWRVFAGFGWVYELAVGLFAVALPEEVFHRGYLMSAFEERWPAKRRLLGVPFGFAAVLSSLVFAVGHLVAMAAIARLATFFPALVFAWLWRKSNSLWAPALFHTASNLLMDVLIESTFPK